MKKYSNFFAPRDRSDGAVYASSKLRVLAMILDLLLIMFLAQIFIKLLYLVLPHPTFPADAFNRHKMGMDLTALEKQAISRYIAYYLFLNLIQCVAVIIYFFVFWVKYSQTPAKMLLKIKIVDECTLESPTKAQCLKRTGMAVISLASACLGLLWVGVDRKNQCWHDKLAGTIVVRIDGQKSVVRRLNASTQDDDTFMDLIKSLMLWYKKFFDNAMIFITSKSNKKSK